VDQATVSTADARLSLNGTFDPTDGKTNRASARLDRLDVAGISRRLKLPVVVATNVTGPVQAQWTGTNFENASVTASLRAVPTRQEAAEDVLPLSANLGARMRGGRAVVELRNVSALGAGLRGHVSAALTGNRAISGELQGEIGELGTLASNVSAFLGEPPPPGPVDGRTGFQVQLAGTMERPTATAVVDGTALRYGPIQDASLHVEAAYLGDQAEVLAERNRFAARSHFKPAGPARWTIHRQS
jgi:hypothetical protein